MAGGRESGPAHREGGSRAAAAAATGAAGGWHLTGTASATALRRAPSAAHPPVLLCWPSPVVQAWSKLPCDPQAAAGRADAAAGLRGLLRGPTPPPLVRSYAAQPNLQEATQRLKDVATIVRTAPEALAKAPGAVYKVLPGFARRLVDAAQTPGAVNRVVSLQLEAFWQHHGSKLLAAGGVLLCYLVW